MREVVALLVLAATLAAAVARPRWAPEWLVAGAGALLLVALGVISAAGARDALFDLGPTVGFLAALLLLADGSRRAGVFEAAGAAMALGARGRPRRLLAMVFLVAAATTAVLSLDATVVLLTPVVFATAARLRTSARPHVYACSHLANSASLLLPVSNLTNLLAFHQTDLSFIRFAALMAAPWLVALAVEWLALTRAFAPELAHERAVAAGVRARPRAPRAALAVLAATLAGFALSSVVHVAPVWVAVAGALALAARQRPPARELIRAAEPAFLVFVLGLAVVVRAAGRHGLDAAVDALLPAGSGLPALLGIAAVSAVLANLVNNLPAVLILVPITTVGGRGPLLATLIGVNIGPNLTYVGSLATLLWRRVLVKHDHEPSLGEYLRLGALTVPAALAAAVVGLWLGLQLIGA
jgi:arsenical pump membrane protein